MVLFCGDRVVAEEVTQEALVRALERWPRVSQMASPEAWVYKTAVNLARSSFRRRALERRANARAVDRAESAALPDTADAVAVRAAVAALPPRQRAAIVARYFAGFDVSEAAAALGCAEGTVKALTHKAMAKLREAGLVDDQEVELDANP
jgi:RNA polymerase sigma factor (sigma-70 family)